MRRADLLQYYLQVIDVRQIKWLPCFIISDFRGITSEDFCSAVQWDHGDVGSRWLRFGSPPDPLRCYSRDLLFLQNNSPNAWRGCSACYHLTQRLRPTLLNEVFSILSHNIKPIPPSLLIIQRFCPIFGHSVLHIFLLAFSSSQAALLTFCTGSYYFKAPFPVFFQ